MSKWGCVSIYLFISYRLSVLQAKLLLNHLVTVYVYIFFLLSALEEHHLSLSLF